MNRWIPLAACAALAAVVPVSAFADPAPSREPGAQRPDGGGRGARRMERMRHRRHRAGRLLKTLELSDAQKESLKAAREAAAPVRDDLRSRILAIFEETRKAAGDRKPSEESRTAARTQVKAAVESARQAVAPSATRFVASLTPEQKQRLAEKATEHGKTFDEARLSKGIERLLLARKRDRGGKR